jgi:hypothetical protein
LVYRMLTCVWSRTRIQLLWTKSHGQISTPVDQISPNLTRTKRTFGTEDEFTVTSSSGIRNHDVRVAEIVAREIEKTKPDKWGCVKARELWSPQEER